MLRSARTATRYPPHAVRFRENSIPHGSKSLGGLPNGLPIAGTETTASAVVSICTSSGCTSSGCTSSVRLLLFQFFRRPVFRSHRSASGVLPEGVPVQVHVPHCRESPSRSERQGVCEFCCVGYWLFCCETCNPPCDKLACGGCHIAGFRKGISSSCWAKPPRSSQAWWSRTVLAYQAARSGG